MIVVKGIYSGSGRRITRVGSEEYEGILTRMTYEFATIDKGITSKEFRFKDEKIRDLFNKLSLYYYGVFKKHFLEKKRGLAAPQLELSTDDFKKMSVRELRDFTLQYYLENLKGKKAIIKKYLKEVVFTTQAGRKIAKGEAMYSAKAVAVQHLQELIENSTYNNWGDKKATDSKDVLGYLNFKSKLIIDGEKRHLRISLTLFSDRKTELKNVEVGKKRRSDKPTQAPVVHSETTGFVRPSGDKNTKKSQSTKKNDENFGLAGSVFNQNAENQENEEKNIQNIPVVYQEIKPNDSVRKSSLAEMLKNQPTDIENYLIDRWDMAQFLGEMEKKTVDSLVITLTGGQGSGKTRFAFQFMNDLAQHYKIAHISNEEHPQSRLYIDKVHQYLNENAQHNINAYDVRSISELDKIIQENEVIVIDSFQKIKELEPKFEIDKDLRKKYNGKLFLVIFQQTTDGKMRGGSKSQFDGDIILFTEKFSDYRENYVYPDKNRYNSVPFDQLKYNIFQQQLLSTDTDNLAEQPMAELAFDVA